MNNSPIAVDERYFTRLRRKNQRFSYQKYISAFERTYQKSVSMDSQTNLTRAKKLSNRFDTSADGVMSAMHEDGNEPQLSMICFLFICKQFLLRQLADDVADQYV
jgi:hypothetical protein